MSEVAGFALSSPLTDPVYDSRVEPLAGVRWPVGYRRPTVEGEVAMFEIEDEGELQEW